MRGLGQQAVLGKLCASYENYKRNIHGSITLILVLGDINTVVSFRLLLILGIFMYAISRHTLGF